MPAGLGPAGAWPADWIVNSRNTADEDVVRTLAALSGFEPRIVHRCDSLDLVQDLIVAGLGVALLPADVPPRDGVDLLPARRARRWTCARTRSPGAAAPGGHRSPWCWTCCSRPVSADGAA